MTTAAILALIFIGPLWVFLLGLIVVGVWIRPLTEIPEKDVHPFIALVGLYVLTSAVLLHFVF